MYCRLMILFLNQLLQRKQIIFWLCKLGAAGFMPGSKQNLCNVQNNNIVFVNGVLVMVKLPRLSGFNVISNNILQQFSSFKSKLF